MKQESHDDGYETSGDLDLRSQLGKEPKFTDFHAHVHVHQHSELDPSLSLQGKVEQSKYFSSTPVEASAQTSKMEHKFVDFHNSLQAPTKEHKFIDYQDSASSYSVKCGGVGSVPPNSDPYNFGEDERISHMPNAVVPVMAPVPVPAPPPAPVPAMIPQQPQCSSVFPPQPKKRGRKRKIRPGEEGMDGQLYNPLSVKDEKLGPYKERKKHDRFNGMPEEEVQKRTLPDHLTPNLDIIIIGINPGLFAAYKGHHYAGPGNHFWKCLYLSGLTPEPMTADDDYKLLNVGIGFTNMVERATKGSADLTRKEIKRGSQILLEKLQKFKPKIAVFNGKLIYEVFSGKKDFYFGRQPDFVDGTNTYMWVMPSSSARCAQLPRAADKVPFYAALKKFRDYLNGVVSDFDESEVVFTSSKLKHYYEPEVKDDPDEKYPYGYPPRLPGGEGTTEMGHPMIKQEDGTTLLGEQIPVKKKRGRPKKIKSDSPDEVVKSCESTKKKPVNQNDDAPKKKRGRPKKIKEEDGGSGGASGGASSGTDTLSNLGVPNPMSSFNQHMAMNHCPQPPFSQGSFTGHNHMMNYNHSTPHTPYHHFSHSPQPASLTHSDLSSEISAAISSEHNLASPSPHSPHLGPGPASSDYDSGGGLSGDVKVTSKSEGANGPPSGTPDCGFHSEEGPSGYQGYSNFPAGNGEHPHLGHSGMPAYPQHPAENINQDVSAKSLSGLESLVDQIPSIADNGGPHSTSVNEGGPDQYSGSFEDSSFMNAYPAVPQHYGSGGYDSGYNTGIRMNFSVTSLPNAPSPGGAGTPNTFPNYSPPSSGSGPGSGSAPYTMPLGPGMHHGMDAHRMMGRIFNGGCDMSMGMGMNYSYNQYSSSGGGSNPSSAASGSGSGSGSGSYPGSPSSSTPGSGGSGYYSPSHPLHMPSPNYPSPYFPSSPYAQPQVGYGMSDRGKQDSDLGAYNGSGF